MKAIIPIFWLTITSLSFADESLQITIRTDEEIAANDDPSSGSSMLIKSIQTDGTSLGELVELMKTKFAEKKQPVPNFVFKNGAQDVQISALKLRNVNLHGFLSVVEIIGDLRVKQITRYGNNIIIFSQKQLRPKSLINKLEIQSDNISMVTPEAKPQTDRGVTAIPSAKEIRSSRSSRRQGNSSLLGGRNRNTAPAAIRSPRATLSPYAPTKPVTRIFSTKNLGIKNQELESAVRAVWSISDPNWEKQPHAPRFLFHPSTGMLIVKAPLSRVTEIDQMIDQLITTHDLAQIQRAQKFAADMEKRAQKLQRDNNDLERNFHETQKDRSALLEKIRELEIQLQKSRATEKK